MKKHHAVRMMVEAEQDLRQARELCTSPGVIELIDAAFNKIYTAGNTLWPVLIDEMRSQKAEAL